MARVLGARSARQAGTQAAMPALADRFLSEAAPDILLLRADLSDPYPLSLYIRLLCQSGTTEARRALLEQLADAQPDLILQWVQQGDRGWAGPMATPAVKQDEGRLLMQRVA